MNTKIHNPADDQAKLKPKSPNKSATHPDSASPNDLRNQDEKCTMITRADGDARTAIDGHAVWPW